MPAPVGARMRRADRHERVVELDHKSVGEGRRPRLDFAEQPRRAELDREVMANSGLTRGAIQCRGAIVVFIASTNARLRLEEFDQRIPPGEARQHVAVSGLAKPPEIAGIAGLADRSGDIDDPRALEFRDDRRSAAVQAHAHRTVEAARENARLAVAPRHDQPPAPDIVPGRDREQRLVRLVAVIHHRQFVLGEKQCVRRGLEVGRRLPAAQGAA